MKNQIQVGDSVTDISNTYPGSRYRVVELIDHEMAIVEDLKDRFRARTFRKIKNLVLRA